MVARHVMKVAGSAAAVAASVLLGACGAGRATSAVAHPPAHPATQPAASGERGPSGASQSRCAVTFPEQPCETKPEMLPLDPSGHEFVGQITWTQWNGQQAIGTGTYISKHSASDTEEHPGATVILPKPVRS